MNVAHVQKDMNARKLGNLIWSMDRGMTSEENRRNLKIDVGLCILGKKLRETTINEEALNRGGRFTTIKESFILMGLYFLARGRTVVEMDNIHHAEPDDPKRT